MRKPTPMAGELESTRVTAGWSMIPKPSRKKNRVEQTFQIEFAARSLDKSPEFDQHHRSPVMLAFCPVLRRSVRLD
jgi:hypothetical protein